MLRRLDLGRYLERSVLLVMLAIPLYGCESTSPSSDTPGGDLVKSTLGYRMYLDVERLEVVPDPDTLQGLDPEVVRNCGYLTTRALDDFREAIAALDRDANYPQPECKLVDAAYGHIYLEGFRNSPFDCNQECCHEDLVAVDAIYEHALVNFSGQYIELGPNDPYIAIDPDRPCEGWD